MTNNTSNRKQALHPLRRSSLDTASPQYYPWQDDKGNGGQASSGTEEALAEQETTAVSGPQPGHDCLFSSNDLERPHVRYQGTKVFCDVVFV